MNKSLSSTPLIPHAKVEMNLKCEMVTIQLTEHESMGVFSISFRI